ncbi:protein ripply1-like isoform X2 [Sphaeramia orbicularis]|uniref:Ripply transcriptional repressor 1 n=1 Tax=Sphaeramia orbicularis TaxID=375764 RepID=A0A672YQA7_9TELE|nr:protein ripply1-like isoform X2 [Sphaeramia orbicularis]
MSSVCLVAKQPALAAAPWLRPVTMNRSPGTNSSQTSLWRPWLPSSTREGSGRCSRSKLSCPYSRPTVPGCFSSDGKPQAFQHPVRLFWPKSKSFDYLYSDGEALLRNFPIQATISFYEESDSEDDDDEDCDEGSDSEECLKQQSHFTPFN